jgi:glycosyltransferase involved in cell wall biosynthesis
VHIRSLRPEVAQFGEFRYLLDSALFLVLTRRCPATAFVDVAHNPLPYDVNGKSTAVQKAGRLTRRLLTAAYQACDLVLVLGDGPRSDLLAAFPGVRRTAVCGHGDYSSVLSADGTPPPSSAPPHALFFGAWTKYKNIPLLLDAFELVRRALPDARLTLAGPVMPDVDLAAIAARAATIGNVDLRPGYVPMDDVAELFAAHRAVVFTYETVNISGSVHMAYTFGRPVVATDVGSMGDAVQDRVTGLLTAPDPVSVAAALVEILGDATAADRMGAQGAARVRSTASWKAVAEKAVPAYREAILAAGISRSRP